MNKFMEFVEHGKELGCFPLFTKSDLAYRWGITRQAVENRIERHEDFPKPFRVVEGKTQLFTFDDVKRYEQLRGLHVHDNT